MYNVPSTFILKLLEAVRKYTEWYSLDTEIYIHICTMYISYIHTLGDTCVGGSESFTIRYNHLFPFSISLLYLTL